MESIIISHIVLCLAVKMYGSTLEGDSARSSNKNGFQLADRGETYSHSRQQHGYYHKPSKLLKQRWNGSKSDQYIFTPPKSK